MTLVLHSNQSLKDPHLFLNIALLVHAICSLLDYVKALTFTFLKFRPNDSLEVELFSSEAEYLGFACRNR